MQNFTLKKTYFLVLLSRQWKLRFKASKKVVSESFRLQKVSLRWWVHGVVGADWISSPGPVHWMRLPNLSLPLAPVFGGVGGWMCETVCVTANSSNALRLKSGGLLNSVLHWYKSWSAPLQPATAQSILLAHYCLHCGLIQHFWFWFTYHICLYCLLRLVRSLIALLFSILYYRSVHSFKDLLYYIIV